MRTSGRHAAARWGGTPDPIGELGQRSSARAWNGDALSRPCVAPSALDPGEAGPGLTGTSSPAADAQQPRVHHAVTHQSRFLRGALEPCPREGAYADLQITGELPLDLCGELFRVGPNPRYVPNGHYHPFFGDGMVYAFGIRRGRASFSNRWIRTRRFLLEDQAGESLFDGVGNYVGAQLLEHASPEVQLAALSGQNSASTNIVEHAGSLLALSEAGLPYQVDRHSLGTVGPFDFGRTLQRSMTGHPKLDPDSGHLFGFSYGLTDPWLVFYEYDRRGGLVRRMEIPAPFPSMVHDFVVTERYVVIPIFPMTMRASRVRTTGSPFGWEPALGTHVVVISRVGEPSIRWFTAESCYAFHVMNGFDDGRTVYVDLVRYESFPQYFADEGEEGNSSRLVRWRLDLEGQILSESTQEDVRLEMPRIDPRRTGRPYRHGYANGGFRRQMFHAIEHFDLETGVRRTLDFGDERVAFEPVFAPRRGSSAEGDGYILVIVGCEASPISDLLVLDAERIDAGPLASVRLPHRVNGNFHGCWVAEDHVD